MARLKEKVLGHEKILQAWTKLLGQGQTTGTFLFVGPQGVGKIKTAWAIIQQALCEYPDRAPCGECASCRRVELGHHESIMKIAAEGAQIKMEQSHDVLQFLQLRSITAKRFVIVEDAQKLNPASANSLLKTLEEPPEGTTFILTAPSITSVLPTIRSRSRVFHFGAVDPQIMLEHQVGPEWAIWASQGRFDRLKNLSDSDLKEFRHAWAHFFTQFILSEDSLVEDTWREKLKNREDVKNALEVWLSLVRDALFLQQGEKKSLLNLDLNSLLAKWSQIPSEKLDFIGSNLIQLQKDLAFNKDAVLSLESLYIQFKRSVL